MRSIPLRPPQSNGSITLPLGKYDVWVLAIGPNGIRSAWSQPYELYVGGYPELPGASFSPDDPATPMFSWNPVGAAYQYELYVNNIEGPERVIHETIVGDGTYTSPVALPEGTYRAWVRAISSTGFVGDWSPAFDFTVDLST